MPVQASAMPAMLFREPTQCHPRNLEGAEHRTKPQKPGPWPAQLGPIRCTARPVSVEERWRTLNTASGRQERHAGCIPKPPLNPLHHPRATIPHNMAYPDKTVSDNVTFVSYSTMFSFQGVLKCVGACVGACMCVRVRMWGMGATKSSHT